MAPRVYPFGHRFLPSERLSGPLRGIYGGVLMQLLGTCWLCLRTAQVNEDSLCEDCARFEEQWDKEFGE